MDDRLSGTSHAFAKEARRSSRGPGGEKAARSSSPTWTRQASAVPATTNRSPAVHRRTPHPPEDEDPAVLALRRPVAGQPTARPGDTPR